MPGDHSFYWMLIRLADSQSAEVIIRAFIGAWARSARPELRWRLGNAKARPLPRDPAEIVRFPEGARRSVRFHGTGERGLLELEGHPAGDTLGWEFPYDAVKQRKPGYTPEAIAALLGEVGDTGSVVEGFVCLPEVQFSEQLKRFRRAHGLDSSRDWLAHVNWIDFVPSSRLPEVGGSDGLLRSGLTILREGIGGVVVTTDLTPPTVDAVDAITERLIEVSSRLWRQRVSNCGGKMPARRR